MNQVDTLLSVAYAELRRLAAAFFESEPMPHTLQPTALVSEAYLRLRFSRIQFANKAEFCAVAARLMREILVDYGKRRRRLKRGRGWCRCPLECAFVWFESRAIDLLALDEALGALTALDPRKARLVELRFFGGLSIDDTAVKLGIGRRTVQREWTFAKSWLRMKLSEPELLG